MWTQKRFGPDRGIYAVVEQPEMCTGAKPLVVTLAGLGQAMSEKNYLFSNLRKRLALDGHWIVQFDYRGHGDSYGELGETSISSMVNDTLTVLEEITLVDKPSRVYLIGNALGAVIAQTVALHWEERTKIESVPILISPFLDKLPPAKEVFAAETLARLEKEGVIDSQILVPGFDYYQLTDFDPVQFDYITRLGAHLLYLHGQCIGKRMLDELDELEPVSLYNQNKHGLHLICGELDVETWESARKLERVNLYRLSDVTHFFRHPAAMDQLIEIVRTILTEDSHYRKER
ncbi:alpha/beta hydrolase [Brevibacillus fulvus]|uniref:Pimeloyl-ACP methyl ester carboxylesterase n=1 Tax=Brevibacillus fulvus TaxID=1125967 RepID=A0A938XTB2_9BACL|nr:alpha/beta hydrolase [Brevibacillus fulvus]MBM7589672.1 pimeloyl-ACP methyl ester carboxylesterase [Brevibacillus fulvus]